jgi:DNA-directed RNA polymerase subunit RPC12/RpoP
MNLGVWCDQCEDWIDDFKPYGIEILCTKCNNRLLIKLPVKRQKQVRIDLAKAIWHLS